MPTAGDIDQFIFIHHPHRGMLFGPTGDVFDNRPYHARKLRRIDIGLAKPQRLWGKPVIAPVGLQIALMQERQQKRRAALCVRPLIFAVWATVSFGQVLEKAELAPALFVNRRSDRVDEWCFAYSLTFLQHHYRFPAIIAAMVRLTTNMSEFCVVAPSFH